jgi:hypothetical protein
VQLLSCVVRVEEEEPEERLSYKLSSRQRLAYDGMIEAAEAVVDGQGGVHRQDEQEKAEEELERRVLQFCIELLDHKLGDH